MPARYLPASTASSGRARRAGSRGDASARDFVGVRIIDRSRDAIGLGRVAGVMVAIDGMADAFAELLCELGSNCRFKEKPELKIAGARFHRHTGMDRRCRRSPHTLIGVAVDNESKHCDSIDEPATGVAAQTCRYRTAFDVGVVASFAVANCSTDYVLNIVERKPARHQVLRGQDANV